MKIITCISKLIKLRHVNVLSWCLCPPHQPSFQTRGQVICVCLVHVNPRPKSSVLYTDVLEQMALLPKSGQRHVAKVTHAYLPHQREQ